MIWECTVCTNHFDGDSPPDICHSCGSPREYFTAYHYYGLQAPTGPYTVTEAQRPRPSYTESTIEPTTCFRFHSADHFYADPPDFYRNFLETRRTFMKRDRFAGRGWNSGFYFATTKESAVAEMLFYNQRIKVSTLSDPQEVLTELIRLGSNHVFLEVTLSLNKIADLTDPIVLEYFLREGPARASFQPSGVPYALARAVASPDKGGSGLTDGIGYHAWSHGWNAVRFPSVRALGAAWGVEHLSRWDILTKTQQDHPGATEESVEAQLRNQAIVVVFSGSLLTRSVSHYAWIDSSGERGASPNQYFEVDAKTLELVRVGFRERNRLTPAEAAALGHLTDDEILEEFTPEFVMWVPNKETI